tara:strand:+ start:233 stop:574 length:342 start_codon:yes stop_codon:yes gene_type:complete
MPTKAAIVTRSQSSSTISSDNLAKSTPLSFEDIDSTLINLRDASFGIEGDDSTTQNIQQGDTIIFKGGTGVNTSTTGSTVTINSTADAAINIDGGDAASTYGGLTSINGGDAT